MEWNVFVIALPFYDLQYFGKNLTLQSKRNGRHNTSRCGIIKEDYECKCAKLDSFVPKKMSVLQDFPVKLDLSIDVECHSRVREGYRSKKSLSLTSYKFPTERNVKLVPVCRFPFSLQSHPIRNNLNSQRILRQPLNEKFRPGRRVFSTRRSWRYGPQCVTPGKQNKSLTFTIWKSHIGFFGYIRFIHHDCTDILGFPVRHLPFHRKRAFWEKHVNYIWAMMKIIIRELYIYFARDYWTLLGRWYSRIERSLPPGEGCPQEFIKEENMKQGLNRTRIR